jgi:hypothetical protein
MCLFACACCQRVWHLLDKEVAGKPVGTRVAYAPIWVRDILDVCERHADGLVPEQELARVDVLSQRAVLIVKGADREDDFLRGGACVMKAARDVVRTALYHPSGPPPLAAPRLQFAQFESAWGVANMAWEAAMDCAEAELPEEVDFTHIDAAREAAMLAEQAQQSQLLRDIFGNPFQPVRIDPVWLAWESGTVLRLAKDIYDTRRFTDLPALGDALEDAGCADAEILGHCRSTKAHVRGCWVVDLLRDKS